jgi:hypothetical protein
MPKCFTWDIYKGCIIFFFFFSFFFKFIYIYMGCIIFFFLNIYVDIIFLKKDNAYLYNFLNYYRTKI